MTTTQPDPQVPAELTRSELEARHRRYVWALIGIIAATTVASVVLGRVFVYQIGESVLVVVVASLFLADFTLRKRPGFKRWAGIYDFDEREKRLGLEADSYTLVSASLFGVLYSAVSAVAQAFGAQPLPASDAVWYVATALLAYRYVIRWLTRRFGWPGTDQL